MTRFRVARDFMDRYEIHQAGGRDILAYWIPPEDLDQLNASIVGTIEVVAACYGDDGTDRTRPEGSS